MAVSVLKLSQNLFHQFLATFLITHLASNFKTSKTKSFWVAEGDIWCPYRVREVDFRLVRLGQARLVLLVI